LESFRSAVGLTEVLLRYEQIGKESPRLRENKKLYLQKAGLSSSIICLAFVPYVLFCLCIIRRTLCNRSWKQKRKLKWKRNTTACCQSYL